MLVGAATRARDAAVQRAEAAEAKGRRLTDSLGAANEELHVLRLQARVEGCSADSGSQRGKAAVSQDAAQIQALKEARLRAERDASSLREIAGVHREQNVLLEGEIRTKKGYTGSRTCF
ncbi:hypothetical protein T484DRAFT_1834980 [Baffinella frigidus]|nr:hypothetical protein T484DRAFT_1834980 [Cryptophyta sp. CCMP2293]